MTNTAMVQIVDFIAYTEDVAYTDNKEKINYNLSKFPHYKEQIEEQRQLKKEAISGWVAGKWIVLYLDDRKKKDGIMYFFDHRRVNFEGQAFFTDKVNQMLKNIQAKYKPSYQTSMDTVFLRKEFLN